MVKSKTVTVTVTAVVKKKSAITISVDPTSGVVPLRVRVYGKLTDLGTGAGLAAKSVKIYLNGILHTSAITESYPLAGLYEAYVMIETEDTHSIYSEFAGDDVYEGCGA